jgi:hypothetical protein
MLHFGDMLVDYILIPFLLWIFIVGGLTGVVLGLGLLVRSSQTLNFLRKTNRWTSMRSSLQPMERPRDVDWVVYRHRHVFGAAFAAGGVFVIYMLARIDFAMLTVALSDDVRPVVVEAIIDAVRWFLIAGGALAVVIGVMLIASSNVVPALGIWLNRWYTPKKLSNGADRMYLTLDDWAAVHPRATGSLLLFGSAIVLVTAMVIWVGN